MNLNNLGTRVLSGSIRNTIQSVALRRIYGPNRGLYVIDEDWDNLIILDSCRYDTFDAVHDLPGTLRKVTSRGSATREWALENFEDRTAYDTVYVSANAIIGSVRDAIDVYKLIGTWSDDPDIWQNSPNPETRSLIEPRSTVERAIEAHEDYPHKRLIVHLLPPHNPYLVKDGEPLPDDSPYRTFDAVRSGEVSGSEMRAVYRENLKYVLEYAAELIEALDGKTVVTADHGELLGEGAPEMVRVCHNRWSVSERGHFDWSHYIGVHEPALVEVPWLEVDGAGRRRIREAAEPEGVEIDEAIIEDQLGALGYR